VGTVEQAPAPLVSIIVAVYNGAATIEACLDSVLNQSHEGCELIVIDGGSVDGTVSILQDYATRLAYWASEPDRGIYDAWNKALARTRGEWVLFLGADDRLADRDTLATVAPFLRDARPQHRVAYGQVQIVGGDGDVVRTVGEDWVNARAGFRHSMTMPHQGVFHHRSLFEHVGLFDVEYRICGDYELLLRDVLVRAPLFLGGPPVVAMGDGGLSNRAASNVVMAVEFHRARYTHGLTRVPTWASFRIFRVRLRAWIERTLGERAAERAARAYQMTLGRVVRPHGR
jgi:glycosyltransferase involved in cell wall biosynthesis